MFVLIESVMNGNTTMGVGATGLDFPTFVEAVATVKSLLSKIDENDIEIRIDTSEQFCYEIIKQDFPVVGVINNIQMEIHNINE